jgi:putative SOS response-associated peptidase YedK
MCGRYDFFPDEFSDLRIRFNLAKDLPLFKPSFNIAPGKDVPVIVRYGDRNVVKLMRWGLVPCWSQDYFRPTGGCLFFTGAHLAARPVQLACC